jgi:preprotein translocase subunit SecE
MNRVVAFVKDSFKEVQTKVSWPSFTELQSSTILVLVASLIFALVIGLVDMGFENALRLFYQSFSR